MQDTATGVPPVIPFEKFKAAAEALGITAKGVTRIEIDTEKVIVHRIVKDEHGRTQVIGQHIARILDTIPLSRTWDEVTV